jgi:beta-glucosidase
VPIGGQVEVSVGVTNTGDRAGDEVVQLYVHHRGGADSHAIKELRGFRRIGLQPGERKKVTFTLHTSQLAHHDKAMGYVVQPGMVDVMVGCSSEHLPLTDALEVTGQTTEVGDGKVYFSRTTVE